MYKVNHTDHLQEVAPVMDDSHEDRDGTNQQGDEAPEEDEEIQMMKQFLLEEFPADDFLPGLLVQIPERCHQYPRNRHIFQVWKKQRLK